MRDGERRIRLLRDQGYCKIPGIRETREDLRFIYGPHYGKLFNKFGFFLARPTNEDPRPDFRVRAVPCGFEHLGVSTGNIEIAGRAAGWAALQMYQNRRNSFMDQLHVLDDGIVGGIDSLERLTSYPTPSKTTPVEMWLHGPEMQTGIRVKNEGSRTLNYMLAALHAEYRTLEKRWDHDAAMGGLVGARSLEEFHGAWDRAWEQETPAAAARNLLESDVFISEPAI